MTWLRRWLPYLALGVVALVTLAIAARPTGPQTLDGHVRSVASELRCMECQGLSLADANTSTAEASRADIRRRIQRGESDEQIKAAYVQTYGEFVLMRPGDRGLSLIVWILPLAVLVVGGVGIAFALRRWRRTPRLVASGEDAAVVGSARHAAEAALADREPARPRRDGT